MSPFLDLFSSAEFWSALILALLGGGGIGGLVGAWSNSRKTEADIDGITADAADKAVKILTESIIDPLREQVAFQETQIQHLEEATQVFQDRGLCAWPVPLAAIVLRSDGTRVFETSSQANAAGRASPGRGPRNNRIQ